MGPPAQQSAKVDLTARLNCALPLQVTCQEFVESVGAGARRSIESGHLYSKLECLTLKFNAS
jgi:hypothetical protein